MSDRTTKAIQSALRAGLVPAEGLELLATGLEPLTAAVKDELEQVATGQGNLKWLRGNYGAGKTFTTRYLCATARQMGFATAEVQISINDTPLHHLETVYRRLIERLTTDEDGVGAFGALVDSWLYQVGEEVRRLKGIDESDPAFATETDKRLQQKLAELSSQAASFSRVLSAYHQAQHEGDFAAAQGLLSWLGGQPHVGRSIMAKAGVKGKVDGAAALTFLRGLLILLRQSGYEGLVVVLDEVETIQRMPAQTREKSLNALRQLMDMLANRELPHLYLMVTGTPEFFESYKGLKGLQPLYERVHGTFDPEFPDYRAPQVHLLPFDRERLKAVGQRVRALYPDNVATRVDDSFLDALILQLTSRFGGEVALVPRLFLKELVPILDKADQHARYDPREKYQLTIDPAALPPEELDAMKRAEASAAPSPRKPRGARLDD